MEMNRTDEVGSKGTIQEEIRHPPQFYKFYRMRQFFKSYEGFYTGSSDLTGRHMSRFSSLHGKWSGYLKDFLPLTLCAREVTVTPTEPYGSYTHYVFSDSALWEDFRQKWRVPKGVVIDYALLLENTMNLLKTIEANPIPHIQKLCLMDLPPELLDVIYQHADLYEARLLSSVCRQLNRIGRRYIFRSRTLIFDFPRSFRNNKVDIREHLQNLRDVADSQRTKTLATTEFLLSRPDLCQELRTVTMANKWRFSVLESTSPQGFEISAVGEEFFVSIHREFMCILAVSNNLVSVTLCSLKLRAGDLECLSKLHFLHTLSLQECYIAVGARTKFQIGTIEFPTIYNVCLRISATTSSMWHILTVCPNIRTLTIFRPLESDILTPPAQIWSRCRFFPYLERLSMNYIDQMSVIPFAEALQAASGAHSLRLTHFKLHTWCGVSDADAHILLDSIQHAPIQVLVLEGLAEAEPPLFEKIAESYSTTLEALTLSRRSSDCRFSSRAVVWPHNAWEYAYHLSKATKLQYFCWNSAFQFETATTSTLRQFENDFIDDSSLFDEDDYGCMDSLGLESLPFAVHCPGLKVFKSDEELSATVLISRSETGFISAQPLNYSRDCVRKAHDLEQWNPSTIMKCGWPYIIPKGASYN